MHACSFLDYISTTDRLKKLLDPGGKPKVPVRFPSWLDRFFSQSGAVYTQSKITNTSLWIICFLDIHAHSRESQAMYVCMYMDAGIAYARASWDIPIQRFVAYKMAIHFIGNEFVYKMIFDIHNM